MRILSPKEDDGNSAPGNHRRGAGRIIDITVPFALFRQRFFMTFTVESDSENGPDSNRFQGVNRAIIMTVLALGCVCCLAGVIFLFYLVKSVLGVDLFPDEHLLK